jgi:dTDP-4-dehydrorhamnose reductase
VKVLVFGRTGQVGTELQRWCPSDWELTALGRAHADLNDPAGCAGLVAAASADVVINAAAYTAVDLAETEETVARTVNGDAPAAMAGAATARGIAFLHLSSDYVFDGSGTAPWHPLAAASPINAYGRSKRMGEVGVLAAGGMSTVLRTSWVFSAHGRNFVKTMLRLGAERDSLDIVADQVGNPTPASDVAMALLFIAASLTAGHGKGGIYHFAGAPDVSWADFARHIFRLAAMPVRVHDIESRAYPTPAERPANSRLDCRDFQATFGLPRPDWREGLREVLSELKESTDHERAQGHYPRRRDGVSPLADHLGRLEAVAARLR